MTQLCKNMEGFHTLQMEEVKATSSFQSEVFFFSTLQHM